MLKKRLGLVAVAFAVATTSTAVFAPAASAVGCAKHTIHWTLKGAPNTSEAVAKANSSQSSCRDLNLTYAEDGSSRGWDNYAGMYSTSSGWRTGSRGYKRAGNGEVDFLVLLSDVRPGTRMVVASQLDEGDWVEIAH